jgi:serine-type D-Ala-D-Ala carboxypeptidase/endopeptidase (penicillin-binding protein 4)
MISSFRRTFAVLMLLGPMSGCGSILPGGVLPGPAASPLVAELDSIFDDPTLLHAHWGVQIRSLDSGETIYARNDERLFLPASNMKLFTAAAALETLGPDYRYRTTIAAAGPVRDGVLEGPLVVYGTGDPTFSGRFLDEPRDAFRAWADSLRAHGITRIVGPIIGVDTAFAGPPLGAGWAWDDLTEGYAAEFGALQFNESMIELDIFPNRNGLQPALVVLTPPTQAVRVINDTRTVLPGSVTAIRVLRDETGSGIILRGEIAADDEGARRNVAVSNPGFFFVMALRETLREQGIAAEGPAIRHTSLEPYDPALREAAPIFTHLSPPLSEILPGMLKPSQNLIAETLLRTVGREVRQVATTEGGAAAIDSLMRAWDLDPSRFRIADGSGLSRYNLVSPSLINALLERMDRSEHRELWSTSLPVAGRDGTLASRMRDPPLADNVHAKTGTLTGNSALSGYLTTARGERIVFSILVNNHAVTAADAHRVVEAALERVVREL